jgi:ketosteroid isomerase-like protein
MKTCAIRTRFAALAMILGVVGFCLPAAGQHHHKKEAREKIEELEQQWRQAQLADDIPAMDKLLSEDFLGITSSGQVVTKAQQLDRMKTRSLMITKLEMSDLKIKLIGQIAVVTSLANIEGTNDGKPLVGSFRYTRVYQKLPSGTWKITNFEATRIPRSGHVHQADGQGPPAPGNK